MSRRVRRAEGKLVANHVACLGASRVGPSRIIEAEEKCMARRSKEELRFIR